MMVCQKVEEKGTTTYNEVADELVSKVVEERKKEQRELDDQRARTEETTTGTTTGSAHTTASKTPTTTSKGKGRQGGKGKFDEKNIRRRVYDALNVLMAMEIITKKKKQITWNGLPTAAKQNLASMKQELHYRQQRLEYKRTSLRELLTQQVCFRNLVARNRAYAAKKEADRSGNGTTNNETAEESTPSDSLDAPPEAPSAPPPSELEKIPLPFIVVNTNQSSVIQCDMSGDRTDVMFNFSLPFELNDDNTILKNMHM